MKILIVAGFAESLRAFRGDLIEKLSSLGVSVHVAAPGARENLSLREFFASQNICVHDLPLQRVGKNPFSDLHVLLSLFLLMRREKPDVLLAYTIKPIIYGMLAGAAVKVNTRIALITGLGYAFTGDRSGFLAWIAKSLYRRSVRLAHKVIFQNRDDEALFRELKFLLPETPSVVVNGSGVDLNHFAVAPLQRHAEFILIARLLGDKGVREYVAAARMIRKSHPEVIFHLVGWIDENPGAISKMELDRWVADKDVNFWGRLKDVRPAIKAASIFVLPSYREGTPRTVLEAMAMGRPIITTDAPGCRETVIDGTTGFLVQPRSVEHLVEAMLRFIDDPLLIQKMGSRSRTLAEDKYDVRKVNATMIMEMGLD